MIELLIAVIISDAMNDFGIEPMIDYDPIELIALVTQPIKTNPQIAEPAAQYWLTFETF